QWVRQGANYPATMVSWDDAMEFCRKLTTDERQSGRLPDHWEFTLPTEAQWEYACRAGTQTRYSFGDDERSLADYACFEANVMPSKENYAHKVGLKRPNAWGLCDLHGNVWELCRDVYDERLPGGRDPENTSQGTFRVIRGGSWNYEAPSCRSSERLWNMPSFK